MTTNRNASNLKDAIKLEEDIKKQMTDLIKQITQEIKETLLSGVRTNNNAGVKNVIVSANVIAKHDIVLAPEYYIPESQAEIVEKYLSNSKSITDLVKRIKSLVDSGIVPKKEARHRLNPNTINVLKESIKGIEYCEVQMDL